ncbi:low specificity L-threonine aldolase [Salinibacterium sp. M195]|uniref:threonine aldolase family protein n=1 Tax=Salinibacterium sp. M195 TaxID=2583374 RepID=UPI001C631466|nr:low specificity L-threonine aldolase [Salinibacterium sp. M195]QYH34558.1 low specificity L-threonine aldolase [Salinibacterium sp. M195]
MTSTDSLLRGYLSDNAAGASPQILDAVVAASAGPSTPYGNDPLTAQMRAKMADAFECQLDVFPVGTGSAANGIGLAALTRPWGSILAHADSHIHNDEAGAPEFFTDGSKIVLLGGDHSKIDPDELRAAVKVGVGDVHSVQASVLSLTQVTETGSVYSIDELRELTSIAREAGLRVHMDGARFANALIALDVSPAEMTWKLGVDILSFGATKNGALTADAIVCFDPTLATELSFRHKRGGQLTSKMRFQSAQLDAYLTDDLWLDNARQSNAMAARLRAGIMDVAGVTVTSEPGSNILFALFPDELSAALLERGFGFYTDMGQHGMVRIVVSFVHVEEDIDAFIAAIRELA